MRNTIEVIIGLIILKVMFACQMPAYAIDKEMAIYFADKPLKTHVVDLMNDLRDNDFDKLNPEKKRKAEFLFKMLLDIAHHAGLWMTDLDSFTSKALFEDYAYFCRVSKGQSNHYVQFDWNTLLKDVPHTNTYLCNLEDPDVKLYAITAGWKEMNKYIAGLATSLKCNQANKGRYFDTEKLECVK